MATLLKVPSTASKGVVVLTTPERDGVVRRDPRLAERIAALHERWMVGLHHNWHDHTFSYDPLYHFSMAGEGDLVGDPVPLVTLDACNFVPEPFRPGGEPFWDVLFVGRPVFFKNVPRLFETVRELYDAGRRDRVLCLCPLPPYDPADRDTVMYDVREVYAQTFSARERRLFSLVTPEYDYPFPFDLETLAHFYRSSRVFVHPATDERRCRVAGYAWACGRPVVAAPAVGSLLPPELRRPPFFYAVEEGESHARRLVDALDSGSAWSAADVAAAQRLFGARHTTDELRRRLAGQPGGAGLERDGDGWALGGLGIRLGRHHGISGGPNHVPMSLAAFVAALAGDPAVLCAAAREEDPEAFLAARAPAPERAVDGSRRRRGLRRLIANRRPAPHP